jgi:two-component system phosphate regulon sensor histidine kinase PhoR
MQSSRFFWKLYFGYVVLILLTASILGLWIGRDIDRQVRETTHRSLLEAARVLATEPFLLDDRGNARAGLARRVAQLGRDTGIRYTIIAPDGTVLADTDEDARSMENHAARAEVSEALEGGVGSSVRLSATLGYLTMYVAVPCGTDGGIVRTALPLGEIEDRRRELRGRVIIAASIGAVAALVLGLFVAQRFTGPFLSISRAARAISAGNFQERLEIRRHDAFGAFAQSFNLMASQLQERIETITDDRNNLWTILSSMVEGVVAVDEKGRVILMNGVAAEILGADARLAQGSSFESVTRVGEVQDAVAETMRSGVRRVREVLLSAVPRDRILEIYVSPIREPSGGVVVVLHDVTELRRLEGVRRDFVANVSHELKTPLTVIRGIVETLLDDEDIEAATRVRFLQKANVQTERISSIVTDLLRLARLESEGAGGERETLDLREPVQASVRSLQPSADDKRIELRVDVSPDELLVDGDRNALRLIVDNILDNAVKYTSAGHVSVRLSRDADRALLEIADTGVGIAAVEQERIFERFYRVDKARSRELGGTGLGLSIVRNAVHAHGGVVQCVSELGRGSTFRVWIPLAGLEGGPPARG